MTWIQSHIRNWSRTHETTPANVERPGSVNDVVNILKDDQRWPSPVRAMGNYHSTTGCVKCDGGTLLDMKRMNNIVQLTKTSVRVQAGALYQDVTRKLNQQGLNFPVNLQVGNVTVGSVACCATKDGSYPGVFGQAGAYVTHVRIVMPDGSIEDIDDSQPELFHAVRSSYGLLGVIVEVTFDVVPLKPISVEHVTYSFKRFLQLLPQLKARGQSMEMYIFPLADRVTVQYRGAAVPNSRLNRWVWWLRNTGVQWGMPIFTRFYRLIPFRRIRYLGLRFSNWIARKVLEKFVHAKRSDPAKQTTDYAHRPRLRAFTFSIWAFPEADYPDVLMEYQAFCQSYFEKHKYAPDMLTVGYRVIQSDHALLSYSSDGDVMTIDPVAVGCDEWRDFAKAYNDWAVKRGGKPLLNQTPQLEKQHLEQAFGQRWQKFKAFRDRYDPNDRLLGPYFDALL